MYSVIESITGLTLSNYDKNLVFLAIMMITFLLFDTCYHLLVMFFEYLLGKRR